MRWGRGAGLPGSARLECAGLGSYWKPGVALSRMHTAFAVCADSSMPGVVAGWRIIGAGVLPFSRTLLSAGGSVRCVLHACLHVCFSGVCHPAAAALFRCQLYSGALRLRSCLVCVVCACGSCCLQQHTHLHRRSSRDLSMLACQGELLLVVGLMAGVLRARADSWVALFGGRVWGSWGGVLSHIGARLGF